LHELVMSTCMTHVGSVDENGIAMVAPHGVNDGNIGERDEGGAPTRVVVLVERTGS
jgi:hypothetical protein